MASTSAQGSGAVTRGRTPLSHITDFLGKGRPFIPSELPTLRDVLRYALYLQEQKLLVEGIKRHNYSTDEITGDVIPALLSQWTRANVKFAPPVVISERRIKERIRNAWTKARNIANRRCCRTPQVDQFSSSLDKLFDITRCRCPITACSDSGCDGCQNKAHVSCACPKEQKIPVIELAFLLAQRQKSGEFSMHQIASADRQETKRQKKALKRKLDDERKKEAEEKRSKDQTQRQPESADEAETDTSEEFSTQPDDSSFSSHRNTVSIPNTALASIRYGVSNRATAAIANGYLMDLMESGEMSRDKSHLVDSNKVLRAKNSVMSTRQSDRKIGKYHTCPSQ